MQSLALILAEQAIRLADERSIEHRQAALARRSAGRSGWTGLRGIAAAISDLPRRLAVAADGPVMPTLSDYPYRP